MLLLVERALQVAAACKGWLMGGKVGRLAAVLTPQNGACWCQPHLAMPIAKVLP
jgi:hypothetical protein